MNYIVNPSWFYWINIFDEIKTFATILSTIAIIILGASIVIMVVNYELGDKCRPDDSEWKTYLQFKKLVPKFIILSVVLVTITIFLPSKETLISMKIAKHATKENLGMTVEGIKSAVDYIVNAMKEIKG